MISTSIVNGSSNSGSELWLIVLENDSENEDDETEAHNLWLVCTVVK